MINKTGPGARLVIVSLFWIVLVFPASVAGEEETCNVVCRKIAEITEKSMNVVFVYTKTSTAHGASSGTGSVISTADGNTFILTNNHVVEGSLSGRAWVVFESGKKAEVEIVGQDPGADLALLKSPELPRGAGPVVFADGLKNGQQVYAVGYPFGVRNVTFGYITALEADRSWPFFWTQTPINPGNSGGPLLNERREMVGVNTAVVPSNIAIGGGISLVLPINYIKRLLVRLTRERVVRHGDAGFELADTARELPPFFEKHGLRYPPEQEGVIVAGVMPGLPAAQAGIKVGDIIFKWNGVIFARTRDLREKIFFDHRPNDEVVITVLRGGQMFERRLKLIGYTPPTEKD